MRRWSSTGSHGHAVASLYGNHCFALMRDGQDPIAVTDGHGTWLHWLA